MSAVSDASLGQGTFPCSDRPSRLRPTLNRRRFLGRLVVAWSVVGVVTAWGQCRRQRVLGEECLACKSAGRADTQTGTSLCHADGHWTWAVPVWRCLCTFCPPVSTANSSGGPPPSLWPCIGPYRCYVTFQARYHGRNAGCDKDLGTFLPLLLGPAKLGGWTPCK